MRKELVAICFIIETENVAGFEVNTKSSELISSTYQNKESNGALLMVNMR